MTERAHPEDILIVGSLYERRLYMDRFAPNQMHTAARLDRLQGRRIRNAYYTQSAIEVAPFQRISDQLAPRVEALLPLDSFEPAEATLIDMIAGLPAEKEFHTPAAKAVYERAIQDVIALIGLAQKAANQ